MNTATQTNWKMMQTGKAGLSGDRPTLGQLVESEGKALAVVTAQGRSQQVIDGCATRLRAYTLLAARFGQATKFRRVPAAEYSAALAAAAKEVRAAH